MIHIDTIKDDEKSRICDIISGKSFKQLFMKQSKEFTKIRPGFRAASLTPSDALTLAKQNLDKSFILAHIASTMDDELEKVETLIADSSRNDENYDAILALVLSGSLFSSDPELYFVLKKEVIDNSCIEKIKNEIQDRVKGKGGTGIDRILELEKIISEKEKECNKLNLSLQEAQEEVDELRSRINLHEAEIASLKQSARESDVQAQREKLLSKYEDDYLTQIAIDESYEHISICEVDIDYTNQSWLMRLADIDENGNIEGFVCDDSMPKYFDNRTRLFHRNGPTEVGAMSVWKWSAIENRNDPTKDYVETLFAGNIQPIEVIVITECHNASDLIATLETGVALEYYPLSRILFSYYNYHGKYTGYLCDIQEAEIDGDKLRIKDSVISLPVYEYDGRDIVRLVNGRIVFRSLSIGLPKDVVLIKDPLEIVKSIILKRVTFPIFKDSGKSRSQYRLVKDFLRDLDTRTVVDEVARASACTETEAERFVKQFIDHANSYVDGDTIEDSVIISVVTQNESLLRKCNDMIKDEWKKENESTIKQANDEIIDLQDQIGEKRKKLSRVNKDIESAKKRILEQTSKLQKKYDSLVKGMEEKEKLAESVEKVVSEKIQKAQENAAEFVASMGFANAIIGKSAGIMETSRNISGNGTCYVPGMKIFGDDIETNETWQDLLDNVTFGLEDAGVKQYYARALGAYMYASQIGGLPLLLVGPNAIEIANAYSISNYGKIAGTLNCYGEIEQSVINDAQQSDDIIIRITNVFNGSWSGALPEILNDKRHFYIITHPYIEDVQIEPKGIYSFVLPICTELFVEKSPIENLSAGIRVEGFSDYNPRETKNEYSTIMKELNINSLVSNNINYAVSNMLCMLDDKNEDYAFMFAFLPYAIMTMQGSKFMDYIEGSQGNKRRISRDLIALGRSIIGDHDESL